MKKKLYDLAHSRAGDKGNTLILSLIPYDEQNYPMLENIHKCYFASFTHCTGFGTFNLNIKHLDLFAAMVPIAGDGDPAKVETLVSKPIWAFRAEDDAIIPVSLIKSIRFTIFVFGALSK